MAKSPQSKDEALEAVDFIVNVLKEHERDLDKLINELGTVADRLGDTGQLSSKVEKVEEKINNLQKEVTNLIAYLSGAPKDTLPIAKEQPTEAAPVAAMQAGRSVILRCKQWEDFQSLAFGAQTISFSYKEEGKVLQTEALKGNQIITYSGELPKFTSILKMWLSKQLGVAERNVLEGALAVG